MNLVPAIQQHTSTHSRSRDVAMPDDSRNHGDERRVRGRDDRGMTGSDRPLSPVPTAAPAAAAAAHRTGDGERDRTRGKSRRHSIDQSQPESRSRRRPQDRSRDRNEYSFESSSRNPPPESRTRHHGREAGGHPDSRRGRSERERDYPTNRPHRPRNSSPSPSSNKRARSPSQSVSGSQHKKSRRDRSPLKRSRDLSPSRPVADDHAPFDPRPPRSPANRERAPKPKKKPGKPRPGGPPPRRGRSRSLSPHGAFSRDSNPYRPADKDSTKRDHSRSSFSSYHRRSISRNRSPPSRSVRPPTSPDTGSRERRAPDSDRFDYPHPPRSPRGPRGSGPGRRGRGREDPRQSRRPQPASGANSVEVNMSARGNFRGGFNAHAQSGYPMRGQYNQGPRPNDPGTYSQSSGHGTPNSSFHGSPPPQSPFGGSRGSWGGQQQYSPQGQYPPQYQQGGYQHPGGSQGHYQGNPANSPPPHGTPTGPSQPYNQGPYRGGYRNSSGNYRGNGFGPGRGGYRGGFKSGQWGSGGQGGNRRGSYNQPDEIEQDQSSPEPMPVESEQHPLNDNAETDEPENPFRPSKDLQVEDTGKAEEAEEDNMPPPSRPPPSGPQGSKFSFAFKAASKPAVTAPKPEISQKFNAQPPRAGVFQTEERSRDDREGRDARDMRDVRDTRDAMDTRETRGNRETKDPRDALPRDVPTGPASSRIQRNDQRQRQEPRQRPDPAPRMRKVKKTMKRLKPRLLLPDDLATSDSVFFRKPGNESVVGSGTYGKVFKAVHVYTKNLVALKRIRMEGERDGFPVTAVREIKLLQSLRHINIINLQEVMVEKNDCFMVFEYMSHDLTGILNHPTFKLEAAQRKHLAMQLFEGLDYLHKRGVLHRDIKAANILVSSDGILKLADFGLARFYAKRHQLDYTNRVITIWYRSPELLLGETQYGPGVDIWSAACVMVEIFTRHAIFPGDGGEISQLEKIYAILGTPNKAEWPGLVDMPWFELLRPGHRKSNVFAEKYKDKLPAAGFDLLAAMFQYDPAKRPSATEVLEHPYFTTEAPSPRQAIELQNLDGDWHEFESKALRRENEKKEREARRAAKEGPPREKEKKRPNDASDSHREHKRPHVDKPSQADRSSGTTTAPAPTSGSGPQASKA